MLRDFSVRVRDDDSGQLYVMTVFAVDYGSALSIVSEITASRPNLSVLGF